MATYPQSHPWMTFSFNFDTVDFKTWLLLGEAHSKCEHVAGVPLRPDIAQRLHTIYLAKGALATTAIEGNTLTVEEVEKRIDGQLELPISKAYLGQEIDNIVSACNALVSTLASDSAALTRDLICQLNAQVLSQLPVDTHVQPGRLRVSEVGVARYRAPSHSELEELMDRYCAWLNAPAFSRDDISKTVLAILRAVLAHVYLAWIHPFGDGNGRTARLIEFFILIHAGVPIPAAHLLSDHYNRTRSEYYRQLTYCSESGGDLRPFLRYAVQGFVDGLKEQLDVIRRQQWDAAWQNYVHDQFQGRNSAADTRRRHLALDLSLHSDGVDVHELKTLSPRIAAAYANKQAKTVSRDINTLEELGLVERKGQVLRACRERILAFLPTRKAIPRTQ